VTTTVAPAARPRSWPFSIGLFVIATFGEFVALSGWYVLHHANPPITNDFYQATDWVVSWGRSVVEPSWLVETTASVGAFLQSSHSVLAVLVLWAGFIVERAMVVIWLRVPTLVVTPAGNLMRRWIVLGAVTAAEIVVWLVWIYIAEAAEPLFAAAVLAIGIHIVHAYEVALIKNLKFSPLLKDKGVIAITFLESAGGVWALSRATGGWIVGRLTLDGWKSGPLLIMLGALLIEHILQVYSLKTEADTGL